MYLYFDKQGILKEIISEPTRALSSNVNKILVYYEGMEDETAERLWVRYKYNTDVVTTEEEVTDTITDEIPHNEKRDLKFFKYFKEYPFFVATVPDAVLGVNGVVLATFRLVRDTDGDGAEDINNLSGDSILTLGLVTFNVEVAVGAELGYIADDGYVSISQFNYLIEHISEFEDDFDSKVDKTNVANRVYATDDNGGQITIPVDSFYDGSIVRRDSNNSITVPLTPTQNGYATSKGYVDTFGKSIVLSLNSTTYVLTAQLKDANGNTLNTQTIDLPLEATVVGGSYDNATQSLILTLQSGQTITIPVGDLVSGLVSTDDLNVILEDYATITYVDNELDTKQDTLVSGTNIKTLNGTSLLGSGDIEFDDEFDEESTNALQNQVISKEIKELNYELAIIREELFEVLLTELDYKVSYAMNYVIPDSLSDDDGTHRLVYSETMLKEVEGNGVALNQNCTNNNGYNNSGGWYNQTANCSVSFDTTTRTRTITNNTEQTSTFSQSYYLGSTFRYILDHKYLLKVKIKSNKSKNARFQLGWWHTTTATSCPANTWLELPITFTALSNDVSFTAITVELDSGVIEAGDTMAVKELEIFDLTQMFGAGNEPTTTSDIRIQWLLSLGYVPYNTGSLKNTTISGVKLVGNNKFDGELESGYIDINGVNQSNNKRARSKNFIKVVPGQNYTLEESSSFAFQDNHSITIVEYDAGQNLLRRTGGTISNRTLAFTLDNDTYYIKFYIIYATNVSSSLANIQVCFHLASANIGYKPYTETIISLPQTTLLGAFNSHDTLSVVEGNVVEGEQLYNIVHTNKIIEYTITGNEIYEPFITPGGGFGQHYGISMKLPTQYQGKTDTRTGNGAICSRDFKFAYSNASGNAYMFGDMRGINFINDNWTTEQTFKANLINITINFGLKESEYQTTIVAQDLHFDQVSSIIEQGGTIEPIFEDVPPNITTTFVVKKAVGE